MSTETETPKKSILTRAMEAVAAKENGEGTEEQPTSKKMIKQIVIGAGVVVAGTAALSFALKRIASNMDETAPEDESSED